MVTPEQQDTAVAEADVVGTAPDAIKADETQTDSYAELYPEDEPDDPSQGEDLEAEGDDDGDGEQAEDEEPIQPPVSLKADQKERFSQLPREAQQFVAEAIQQREQETARGVEEARTKAQRQAESIVQERSSQIEREYAEAYDQFASVFAPQPPDPRLAQHDPGAYIAQKAMFDEQVQQFNGLKQHILALRGRAEQTEQARYQQIIAAERDKLLEIPEIANEETRAAFLGGVVEAASFLGYDDDALANVDSRDVLALRKVADLQSEIATLKVDAEKWRAYNSKRNERPREADSGRFRTAPAGGRTRMQQSVKDPLAALYPND